MQDEPQNQSQSRTAGTRHQCYLCHRSYERQDHLSRHLKSHDNERSYRCSDCGKGFNRADLLNRHRAAHAKSSAGEVFRKRTPRACEACIKAKTKCDNDRPCTRCRTREIPCQETEARSEHRDEQNSTQPQTTGENGIQLATPSSLPRQSEDSIFSQPDLNASMAPFQMGQNTFGDQLPANDFAYPDFFEQIMMSDMTTTAPQDQVMMPLDVSDFTQDINLDAFDFDFSFLAGGLTRPSSAQGFRDNQNVSLNTTSTAEPDAHLRSETFKRSPWSWHHWIPGRNHTTFTGQDEINIQEDRVDATNQHVSPSLKRSIHCELEHEARDRMIRVVTQTASSRLAMPSFPSLELLEDLMDVCLLQDSHSIDSFIHVPTFNSRNSLTELLLAMAASGSRYIALAPVWKMGLIIQEVVRLAVSEVFERDNSSTRRLQPLQAYLLWVGVGVWSGFRRKTEIACSFLQPAVTMLTWSNSLSKFLYHDYVPLPTDTDEVLNEKWRAWLEQEGRKRLVYRTFLHDSQVAIAHMQNPIVAPAQMMLPLPASSDFWQASSAHAWRNLYITKQPPLQSALPSMLEVFGSLNTLDGLTNVADQPLCVMIACHAMAYEVWQFRQQSHLLSNWQEQGRKDRWLTHLNRQRDVLENLTTMSAYCDMHGNLPPEIIFTVEFLIMALHGSLEDIQIFSGKHGEEEARKVYPRIRDWTQDTEARTAVWHAGQVLRIARTFEKTRLRDFYAVAVYQAVLTLWVYGMVTNVARKSGDKTPIHTNRSSMLLNPSDPLSSSNRVFLDDTDEKSAKSFKLLGQGTPGLKSSTSMQSSGEMSSFCSLHNSRGLMVIGGDILESNFPESRNALPPLVENLTNLMSELGKLSGR
ncbi:hypothetical protein PRZ48_011401 [Zasmidium cellare]|uniref:Uncharacterized protein n=1 Tax=Zasmidium cellare TaxID=395010 RepID=A0ABR0E689_ZASCE|nr:hypothetical protein PRZ48_011401 [Zasmidium cellare]